MVRRRRQHYKVKVVLLLLLGVTLSFFPVVSTYGDQLRPRSVQISDSIAGDKSIYNISFDNLASGPLGSIQVLFCDSPIPEVPCNAPSGFDITGAVIQSESGYTGFSISTLTTPNMLVLTRPPSSSGSGQAYYSLSNVLNSSVPGAYYTRVRTYASSDTSGSFTNYGSMAFDIMPTLGVSAEVPQSLTFCVGNTIPQYDCASAVGNFVDFGELSSSRTSTGSTQMLAAGNPANGLGIYVSGTTLTSGNDVIDQLTNNGITRAGTNQFGINLRSNSNPVVGEEVSGPGIGQPDPAYAVVNNFHFTSGDLIASAPGPDLIRRYTASYIVNVQKGQAPGVYVSTLTYICLANF